jgi:AcrR family transcriptional regulator
MYGLPAPRGGNSGRHKKTTPVEIEQVALHLFRGQGFAATTVEQIAAGAGISTRSFFRYFRSKDEVIFGTGHAYQAVLLDAVAARPAERLVLPCLEPALVRFAEQMEPDRDLWLLRGTVARENPAVWPQIMAMYFRWELSLAEALQAAEPRPVDEFQAKVVAAEAIAVLVVAMRQWFAEGGVRLMADVVRDAMGRADASLAAR